MSQALYRKWRPRQWDEMVGQEHVVQTLRNAISGGRVGHAYLFSGPRGTGKTTAARLLAKAVNCLAPQAADRPCNRCALCQAVNEGRFLDLIEIDAASNTSVEDVRDLRDKINFSPTQGAYKVYIIDEVHMLSTAAFNALLKTLEEPPPHAIFILATTEIHKIPATVLSRCQRHEFRRIPVREIVKLLEDIAEQEKLVAEPEALTLIARQATGSMRDAISLFDQLMSTGQKVTLASAQLVLGTATSQVVIDLVQAILQRRPAAGLNQVRVALDAGTDARQFARQIVDYLRNLLLIKMGSGDQVDATAEQRSQMAQDAQAFDTPWLMETLRIFNSAAVDQRSSWQPGLALELAIAQSVEDPAAFYHPAQAPAAVQTHPVQSQAQPGEDAARAAPQAATALASAPSAKEASAPARPAREPASTGKPAASGAAPAQGAAPPAGIRAGEPSVAGFQGIQQNWPKIRALVKKRNPMTEALLNSCKPMGIKEGVLILGFRGEVIKSKMESNDNLQIVRQAIKEATGFEIQVNCLITTGKGSSLPNDMDHDGMVGTALRDLGGEIVDIK
jgi:DNA polymerase III subunit gamma/tau